VLGPCPPVPWASARSGGVQAGLNHQKMHLAYEHSVNRWTLSRRDPEASSNRRGKPAGETWPDFGHRARDRNHSTIMCEAYCLSAPVHKYGDILRMNPSVEKPDWSRLRTATPPTLIPPAEARQDTAPLGRGSAASPRRAWFATVFAKTCAKPRVQRACIVHKRTRYQMGAEDRVKLSYPSSEKHEHRTSVAPDQVDRSLSFAPLCFTC
jgi:hypothetical protein